MPEIKSDEDENGNDELGVMSNIPKVDRSKKGNEIVKKKLEELGFTCIKPEKYYQDTIAVKGKCRIPVQSKPLPLTRTNDQTSVINRSLKKFTGLYVIWVERKNEDDAFLYIPDELFRCIMYVKGHNYPKIGKVRPHKDRWNLYVPRSLKGFERYADDTIPNRYCKDKQILLDDLRRNRSDT